MSKKLEKNGLWESSRMMLPQHKEALQNRHSSASLPRHGPTTEDIDMMRDSVLLPIMHTIVVRKADEVETSAEALRMLYAKAAQALAKHIRADLTKIKKSMAEKKMLVFELEKDDRMIRYRYKYREYEDTFTMTRDYMRVEIGIRLGRYIDGLVAALNRAERHGQQHI